jgi:hypothetical protein
MELQTQSPPGPPQLDNRGPLTIIREAIPRLQNRHAEYRHPPQERNPDLKSPCPSRYCNTFQRGTTQLQRRADKEVRKGVLINP